MKLKVTQKGVFDAKGEEIEVGKTLTVDGDQVPAWLVNKAVPLDGETDDDKGYEGMKRDALDALAKERGVDISEAKNKGDVIAALQLADEAPKTE